MFAWRKGGDRWLLPLSGILLVMGGLLGVQVRTQSVRGASEIGRRTSALAEMLSTNQVQVTEQKKEIEGLRARLAKYEATAANDQGMTKIINEDLQNSKMALGLMPVKGPGIVLELRDSTMRTSKEVDNADLFVLHDSDLIQVANELWADGAEAVSVNGQRLVAGSAIVCSGRLIQVNHASIAVPFVFTAIGDQKAMLSGLNIRHGVLDTLKALEFQVKLTPKDDLEAPAIAIAPKYQYARPVTREVAP
jgi:uncharacterized protein YlxW (UPF0749 family)